MLRGRVVSVVYRNAIAAVPADVGFRRKFLEALAQFRFPGATAADDPWAQSRGNVATERLSNSSRGAVCALHTFARGVAQCMLDVWCLCLLHSDVHDRGVELTPAQRSVTTYSICYHPGIEELEAEVYDSIRRDLAQGSEDARDVLARRSLRARMTARGDAAWQVMP